MAYDPTQTNYLFGGGIPLQGTTPLLQGSTPTLQGSSPTIQNNPQPAPITTYGNTAATSPAKQKYINDLSATYGLSGGTVYNKSTNTGLSLDQFKQATGIQNPDWSSLKFDTAYKPISFGSPAPTTPSAPSAPSSIPSSAPSTIPETDPMVAYKAAYSKYVDSLSPSADVTKAKQAYNDYVANANLGISNIEGQGRGIPLSLVRGQQEKLRNQSEIEAARLQGDIKLAEDAQTQEINKAKANVDYQQALKTYGEDALTKTATALLAQLKTLPDQKSKDDYIRTKANQLGLSIDAVNSALQIAQQGTPVKLGEGDALFDPATGKLIYKNPKTYEPDTTGSDVLSPTEALALGVPYGTTKGQAMALGITPEKPLTEAQAQAATYGLRIKQSGDILNQVSDKIVGMNPVNFEAQKRLPSYLQSADFQSYDQAARNFINAQLRRESGAVISPTEFENAYVQYLPRPGDTAQTLQQKAQNREAALNGLIQASGRGYDLLSGQSGGGTTDDPLGLGFNSVGKTSASTSGARTDRHNNPTAFTTDIAKLAGLKLGVDYTIGDPFPNNPNLRTARLIGNPVSKTIQVIDKIGFYTASGKPRWTYVSQIPGTKNWNNLSYSQKASVIRQMYAHEGGSQLLSKLA